MTCPQPSPTLRLHCVPFSAKGRGATGSLVNYSATNGPDVFATVDMNAGVSLRSNSLTS